MGPSQSAEDLASRTGLPVDGLETLAASGALASIGLGRREGIWAAGSLSGMGPDQLALAAGARPPELRDMDRYEQMAGGSVVDDDLDHPSCRVS